MDLTGEYRIPAPQQKVWEALNDPEVLRACIAGCESVDKTSDTEMTAVVNAKVGPLRARFNGKVTLSNINPPTGYTLTGEGQGSAGVGFARGSVDVNLREESGETVLSYVVTATVGGKLAQVGSRLIDSVAQQQAKHFFGKLTEQFAAEAPAVAAGALAPAAAPTPAKSNFGYVFWPALLFVVMLILLYALA